MVTPLFQNLKFPKVGVRIYKTLLSVFIIVMSYEYLFNGRNPCFACIGAVFGLGNVFKDGIKSGGNRFVGTLLGGLVVIPVYWLYYNTAIPLFKYIWVLLGLFCVIYVNLMFGVGSAIQPGTVVYFVVMYTVTNERFISYTIARIIDTGVGVLLSLFINMVFPSPHETVDIRREIRRKLI